MSSSSPPAATPSPSDSGPRERKDGSSKSNDNNNNSRRDSSARLKAAASLLVKGGTLTDEPCGRCKGVQVRFADKTTCINCGNETAKSDSVSTAAADRLQAQQEQLQQQQQQQTSAKKEAATGPHAANLASAASAIEDKIAALAEEVRAESDVLVQKQKADLIESYLRILEKVKSLSAP